MEARSCELQENIEYYFSQLSYAEQAHCLRVRDLSIRLGQAMNLPKEKFHDLAQAAAFHDVGKIKIPKRILEKPGKLTDEERTIIMVHSKYSSQILEQTGHSKAVIQFAMLHHENFDGTGYPFGYSDLHIPLESRIIRVADAFDALHSKRSYKEALPIDICLGIMRGDEVLFDRMILKHLEAIL